MAKQDTSEQEVRLRQQSFQKAIELERCDILEDFLTREGFDLWTRNERGETPIIHAARLGSCTVMEVLRRRLDFALSMNKQEPKYGNTALHFAVLNRD